MHAGPQAARRPLAVEALRRSRGGIAPLLWVITHCRSQP